MSYERISCQTGAANEGFSLVAVLWIGLAISAVLTPLTIAARTQTAHVTSLYQADRLNYLAEGIASVLIAQLRQATTQQVRTNVVRTDSTLQICSSGKLEVFYLIQSHAGLVNVNQANARTLEAVLAALGQERAAAMDIAKLIVTHRSYSTSDKNTSNEEISGGAKSAKLESVSELYYIAGLGNTPYRDLHKTFTTHTSSNAPAFGVAPEHIRQALRSMGETAGAGSQTYNHNSVPITASVVVRRGTVTGQFNGIFAKHKSQSSADSVIETWRYDEPLSETKNNRSADCSSVFGNDFSNILEELG